MINDIIDDDHTSITSIKNQSKHSLFIASDDEVVSKPGNLNVNNFPEIPYIDIWYIL